MGTMLMCKIRSAGSFLNLASTLLCVCLTAVMFAWCFGVRPYVVLSGSMEPQIHTGSICFINTRASYEDVEAGDVIAYEAASDMVVTHRAVRVTRTGIETKGDANDVSDGITTTKDNFKGKLVFDIPRAGYLIWGIKNAISKLIHAV